MSYSETLAYLMSQLPMYQRIGVAAFKKDLTNTLELCKRLGNPETRFPAIHVAGTNGKGSVSYMLSAVLQAAGFKTGLYISPHYKDFRERIRVNGAYITKKHIIDFVANNKQNLEEIKPSFFETTVAMAFDYFASAKVDIAVIETGLGGRLDSTNVLTPLLSVITNISYDHMNMLGETLPEIAFEKAGIIKRNVPVIIGEEQPESKPVFETIAKERNAPISFASRRYRCRLLNSDYNISRFEVLKQEGQDLTESRTLYEVNLGGGFQEKNLATVLQSIDLLNKIGDFTLSDASVRKGLKELKSLTNFIGRWQKLGDHPLVLCDSAHNTGGLAYTLK